MVIAEDEGVLLTTKGTVSSTSQGTTGGALAAKGGGSLPATPILGRCRMLEHPSARRRTSSGSSFSLSAIYVGPAESEQQAPISQNGDARSVASGDASDYHSTMEASLVDGERQSPLPRKKQRVRSRPSTTGEYVGKAKAALELMEKERQLLRLHTERELTSPRMPKRRSSSVFWIMGEAKPVRILAPPDRRSWSDKPIWH